MYGGFFEKLPEKQKEVVFKCCIEGKLYRETAQEMQISENTVKTHLLRAMKFFRQELRGDILFAFHAGEASFEIKRVF